MKTKSQNRESFIHSHKYSLVFFVYLIIYHVTIVNRFGFWKINDIVYSNYCVDYSFGFASKLLPGAVFRFLFGSHASKTAAQIYVLTLIILFFALLSILLEAWFKHIPENYRKSALILIAFFLSGAYTFSVFTKWIGIADTAWLFIIVLFLICLEHKFLRYAIPLIYVLALLIHFSALVFILPLFSTLLIYLASITYEKKEKNQILLIFAISIVLAMAAFSVLMLNETRMVCSFDEFHRKLIENGTDYFNYHDYSFFHRWGGVPFVPESVIAMKPSVSKFLKLFYYQAKLVYDILKSDSSGNGIKVTLCGFVLTTPAVLFFFKTMAFNFKASKKVLKRMSILLMMALFPFVFVLGILFAVSVDMTRYYTYSFLMPFISFLFVLYHEERMQSFVFETMHSLKQSMPLKIYFLAYFTAAFLPSL